MSRKSSFSRADIDTMKVMKEKGNMSYREIGDLFHADRMTVFRKINKT